MTRLFSLSLFLVLLSACSGLTPNEKEAQRQERQDMAEETIKLLLLDNEELQADLNTSVGYLATSWKVTKVPFVGFGGGYGILVDSRTKEKTYVNVSRFDIGGGWGVRSYHNLLVIQSQEVYEEIKNGTFTFQGGAEVAAGTAATGGSSSGLNSDFKLYTHLDGGGSATATVRVLIVSVDDELAQTK